MQSQSSEAKVTDHRRERNGEIDYKKVFCLFSSYSNAAIFILIISLIIGVIGIIVFFLQLYDESQQANTRLKEELQKLNNDHTLSKKKLEEALKV